MDESVRELDRRSFLARAALGAALAGMPRLSAEAAGQQTQTQTQTQAPAPPDPTDRMMCVPTAEIKWERLMPEAGEWSPEIAILHVGASKATQLMIRVPRGQHVPPHWHSANETHTVLSGTFVIECDGQKTDLGPGAFNYMPARMVHQAWTKPDEGTVVFITVDAAWDVHFLTPPKFGKPSD